MDIHNTITEHFNNYLQSSDCLQEVVVSLIEISIQVDNDDIFSENAMHGFNDLNMIYIRSANCPTCNNAINYKWFRDYAQAWVDNKCLPTYSHPCYTEHIMNLLG